MAQFNAQFVFEAATLEEAESIVGGWTVTPGAMLMPIHGTVSSDFMPVEVPESGDVGEAIAAGAPPATGDIPVE